MCIILELEQEKTQQRINYNKTETDIREQRELRSDVAVTHDAKGLAANLHTSIQPPQQKTKEKRRTCLLRYLVARRAAFVPHVAMAFAVAVAELSRKADD